MMTPLPGTAERIPLHTDPAANDRIVERTMRDIAVYEGSETGVRESRIAELDREWDVERIVAAADGAILLAAGLAGLLSRRRWLFVLPAAVGALLLQQALIGSSAQMAPLRGAGVRTPYEIAGEKAALAP